MDWWPLRRSLQRLCKHYDVKLTQNYCGTKAVKLPNSPEKDVVTLCNYEYQYNVDHEVIDEAHIFGYYSTKEENVFIDSAGMYPDAYNVFPFEGAPQQLPKKSKYGKWSYPEPDFFIFESTAQGPFVTCAGWFILIVHMLMSGMAPRDINSLFIDKEPHFLHPIVRTYLEDYSKTIRNYNNHPDWNIDMTPEATTMYDKITTVIGPPTRRGRPSKL